MVFRTGKHGKVYNDEKRKMIIHQKQSGEKLTSSQQKEYEAFVKLTKLNQKELKTLEQGLNEAIAHYKYKSGKVN